MFAYVSTLKPWCEISRHGVSPRQAGPAQAVKQTIADFVNPERINSRDLLERVMGQDFQNRLY